LLTSFLSEKTVFSMVTCNANDPDPTNETVNNGCGLPFCDSSGHCAVATRC